MNLPKETKEILEALAPELSKSEDESIRKFLVDYFTSYKIGNVATKLNGVRIDDILNYLEKQKEQKPAEWSEEDKDKVVQYLHDRDGGMLWSKATDITRDILDMLRPVSKESLQPHWKPSEGQLSMLLAVINDPNNAGSASCHIMLKSLYNDLKKL